MGVRSLSLPQKTQEFGGRREAIDLSLKLMDVRSVVQDLMHYHSTSSDLEKSLGDRPRDFS
jgi:hypothetical protein